MPPPQPWVGDTAGRQVVLPIDAHAFMLIVGVAESIAGRIVDVAGRIVDYRIVDVRIVD